MLSPCIWSRFIHVQFMYNNYLYVCRRRRLNRTMKRFPSFQCLKSIWNASGCLSLHSFASMHSIFIPRRSDKRPICGRTNETENTEIWIRRARHWTGIEAFAWMKWICALIAFASQSYSLSIESAWPTAVGAFRGRVEMTATIGIIWEWNDNKLAA